MSSSYQPPNHLANAHQRIIAFLNQFDKNPANTTCKRGLYVYGESGCGKTSLIIDTLEALDYDIIKYDAGDVRNKLVIETIFKFKVPPQNILAAFTKKKRQSVLVMDEIDGMNAADKGGLNMLIKLIRPKKNKKQQKEDFNSIPIICIGTKDTDKKLRELMKICMILKVSPPPHEYMTALATKLNISLLVMKEVVGNDLHKLKLIEHLLQKNGVTSEVLDNYISKGIIVSNKAPTSTRTATKRLLGYSGYDAVKVADHESMLAESERGVVAMLFHENVVDHLDNQSGKYMEILEGICQGDANDTVAVNRGIPQLSELSSLMKLVQSSHILHSERTTINDDDDDDDDDADADADYGRTIEVDKDLRFTKMLTKYATEYNNTMFIAEMCTKLNIDRDELLNLFSKELMHPTKDKKNMCKTYNLTLLQLNRILRYVQMISYSAFNRKRNNLTQKRESEKQQQQHQHHLQVGNDYDDIDIDLDLDLDLDMDIDLDIDLDHDDVDD